jgi:hypothetical protein
MNILGVGDISTRRGYGPFVLATFVAVLGLLGLRPDVAQAAAATITISYSDPNGDLSCTDITHPGTPLPTGPFTSSSPDILDTFVCTTNTSADPLDIGATANPTTDNVAIGATSANGNIPGSGQGFAAISLPPDNYTGGVAVQITGDPNW